MAYISFVLATATVLIGFASSSSVYGGFTRDPLCPFPSARTTYFSNPENCAEFFECYEGRKYILKCNDNLYWNQEKLECDYRQNVKCNPKTPLCDTLDDGSYIADPTDCSKFYECVDHKALGAKCAPGTLWNQEILNCDYPKNVKC